MTTTEDMEVLVQNFPIVAALTEKLRILMVTGDSRIPAWHPGYFRDYLEKELPEEYCFLVEKADFWDFSFVKAFENLPDMLAVDPVLYPALFKPFDNSRLVIVPIALFRSLTATDSLNASALRELATLLAELGREQWFVTPDAVKPSDSDKRNALRVALLDFARSKPKVFADMATTTLYVSGFDSSEMATKKEVFALLEELLIGE